MPASNPPAAPHLRRAFLSAWLVAATADILVAVTYYPLTTAATPTGILQGIAAGVLGPASFAGGIATAALGLLCHYTIALIWTAIFFALYPRLALLRVSVPLTAILYGAFVSCAMSFVVLPLSRVAHRPFNASFFAVATLILMVTIGLPLAAFARRAFGATAPPPTEA